MSSSSVRSPSEAGSFHTKTQNHGLGRLLGPLHGLIKEDVVSMKSTYQERVIGPYLWEFKEINYLF